MLRILTAASLFMPLMAYSVNICSRPVVVAVVDTGLDVNHPAFKDHLWVNKGEIPGDGKDNDGNGYKDDVNGFDFVEDVGALTDTHGHGTHVSGIVLGTAYGDFVEQREPTSIVPKFIHAVFQSPEALKWPPYRPKNCIPEVRIMPLKYYSNGSSGYNNLANTVRAIEYAVANGADIINYSGGGADPAASERAALDKAHKAGVLVVAAAGNDGRNNDRRPYYPASYSFDNIIAVAGINKFGRLMPSSNFGNTVDVAAIGLMVLSTLPGGKYGTMSGTSQATPVISGLSALLMSMQPKRDYKKVKAAILDSTRPMALNASKQLLRHGIVDLKAAVSKLK